MHRLQFCIIMIDVLSDFSIEAGVALLVLTISLHQSTVLG